MINRKALFLITVAVLILFIQNLSYAAGPEVGKNWGDLTGTGDALGVLEEEPVGDTSYFYKPAGFGPSATIPLTFFGATTEFRWSTFPVDAVLIRTIETAGSISGSVSTGDFTPGWERDEEEEEIGTFEAEFASGTSNVTYNWDFSDIDDIVLIGSLYVSSNDIEVASIDHIIVKVNEDPVFDVFAGLEDLPQSLRPFGPIYSTEGDLDLGLIIAHPDTGLSRKIDIVFANLWNEQVRITNSNLTYETFQVFAPDLYEDEEPAFVTVESPDIADPALASHFQLPEGTLTDSGFDITFEGGNTLSLSWLWGATIFDDGPNAVGMIPIISSSDINDDIDPDVTFVVNGEDFSSPPPDENFSILTTASPGEYIGQFSFEVDVPVEKQGALSALPLGLRFAIEDDEIGNYSEELYGYIQETIEQGERTQTRMIEILRENLSFIKAWSNGATTEIKLNDPNFQDAADIWIDYDNSSIFFAVNLIIVNGGEPGNVSSAMVDNRRYIVIYDGTMDDKFADPLMLSAATTDSSKDATGTGSGGCASISVLPIGGILLLPLLILLKK